MHDLDRTTMEMDEMNPEAYEFTAQGETPFSDAEAVSLAAELLSVGSDAELNQFLGDVVKKVWAGAKKAASSPVGQQLISGLKNVAKQALPSVGRAVGDYVAPGKGGDIGAAVAEKAGSLLGLEVEGLSAEDAEIEAAKQIVQLAGAAAHEAKNAPAGASPAAVAKAAIVEAAKTFAPGLVAERHAASAHEAPAGKSSGRWVRKGKQIILFGV